MQKKWFRAPARVNLIGEHTDYNDGLVLPTTTALYTTVATNRRDDRRVVVESFSLGETDSFSLDHLVPGDKTAWIEYLRGVAAGIDDAGIKLVGADVEIQSEIPLGIGLSSSAALELAVACALLHHSGAIISPRDLAALCQTAEQRFAHVQCGIMDQYTIAGAQRGHALLLDCRTVAATQVPIPASIGFVLTDSGVRHRLPDGDYNSRASECSGALDILRTASGLTSLRDLDSETLSEHREALGDVLYRRCRHVMTENARVEQAAAALRGESIEALGALISESHASLRDDFEVSCAEVDALVGVADASPSVLGSRQIGGGFGGCVLSVVPSAEIDAARAAILAGYIDAFGRKPWMHTVMPAEPAGEFSKQ